MRTREIDVTGLPEPIIRSLEQQVEHHRQRLAKTGAGNGHVRPLPQLPGIALPPEQLRRENLYDD